MKSENPAVMRACPRSFAGMSVLARTAEKVLGMQAIEIHLKTSLS